MAVVYVRSGAAGTGTGADWTNAYTTLAAALNAVGTVAGSTIWVSDDHAESTASTLTLTSQGTAPAPCRILCANAHTSTPPTGVGTTAVVATTGASSINFAGYAYVYGIVFNCADSNNNATISARVWRLESCQLNLTTTGTGSRIALGGTAAADYRQELLNCTFRFGNATQGISLPGGNTFWRGGGISSGGTAPTVLLLPLTNINGSLECTGLDLSFLSAKSLVTPSTVLFTQINFRNCKLPASFNVLSAAIPVHSLRVNVDDCDSANTNYRMARYAYQGSVSADTVHTRTGGASDGTTALSHAFTTLASGSGPSFSYPLEGPYITIWNDVADGSTSRTIRIELCTEGVTLFDDDVWISVEYAGTAGFPQAVLASTRITPEITTHQSLASRFGASSATWTGFTTPTPQRITLSITPQQKGVIRARVLVAKGAAAVYVDPLLIIT